MKTECMLNRQSGNATGLGACAILLWSTAFACNRSLAEQLGPVTAAASFQVLGGLVGLLVLLFRKNGFRELFGLPKSYLFGCGILFVLSQTCTFISVGLAVSREQAIQTSLVYYMWPILTFVFALLIFRQRTSLAFIPGIMIAILGVVLVTGAEQLFSEAGWLVNVGGNIKAYLLAALGGVCWALYSNLSRKFSGSIKGSGVPLFLLATGLFLALLRQDFTEISVLSPRAVGEIVFMGLCPQLLAFLLWDTAVRNGNFNMVASMSYLTPFLSALVASIYLQVMPGWSLWVGCVLIILGAVICNNSIRRRVMEISYNKH